jgi:predicted Zn-dependent peptidase
MPTRSFPAARKDVLMRLASRLLISVLCFTPQAAWAGAAPPVALDPSKDTVERIASGVITITLPNGLRVLVVKRGSAPVVTCMTFTAAGAVQEDDGAKGVSILLQQMAWDGAKGTDVRDAAAETAARAKTEANYARIIAERRKDDADFTALEKLWDDQRELDKACEATFVPREMEKALRQAGADGLNALSGPDSTICIVSLPSSAMELWASLEADRLANLEPRSFRPALRAAAMRLQQTSDPAAQFLEDFRAAAFHAHPYGRPLQGRQEDIENITRDDVLRFHRRWFTPSNTVIALVGDIDAAAVKPLIEKYFGPIPPARDPERPIPAEPLQRGERRIKFLADAQPMMLAGWHVPQTAHPDFLPLSMLAEILSTGRAARFQTGLVRTRIAAGVSARAGMPGVRYPSLFLVQAAPARDKSPDELETAAFGEIERIQNVPPAPEELDRVRARMRMDFLRAIETREGLAGVLCQAEAFQGGFKKGLDLPARLQKITPRDISGVARVHLREDNRTVGWLLNEAAENARRDARKGE